MLGLNEKTYLPFAIILAVAIWSIYQPYDLLTWFLESAPVLILFAGAWLTAKQFSWTSLSYWLFTLGCVLVLIGAHYTYALMPVFEWIREAWMLERNHYDRFGHFFQGAIPAILFRELLLRTSPIGKSWWLPVIIVALCTAKSVLYEFAEWWIVLALGENAHEFLAMQGDEWDAQKDMFLATTGSICALGFLSRWHDKQLKKLI